MNDFAVPKGAVFFVFCGSKKRVSTLLDTLRNCVDLIERREPLMHKGSLVFRVIKINLVDS